MNYCRYIFPVVIALASTSCTLMEEKPSEPLNALGWPSKGLGWVGFHTANSELPLIRESGRVFQSLGDFLDMPALAFEEVTNLDFPSRAFDRVFVGLGGTVTAVINLPFCWFLSGNLDIGREADNVNAALEYLEGLPRDEWSYWPGDTRDHIFPPGTRVRASGKNLIWELPDGVEIVQAAESSMLFRLGQILTTDDFLAQERSWGFVVGSRTQWNRHSDTQRAATTIHEFYHQEQQMRRLFRGWNIFYWPAYAWSFTFHGWNGHWAEVEGGHAAGVVDRGLREWRAPVREIELEDDDMRYER